MKTRSQTATEQNIQLNATIDSLELLCRRMHQSPQLVKMRGAWQNVREAWGVDWPLACQIIWFQTGIEEGVFEHADVPDALYASVHAALHGR